MNAETTLREEGGATQHSLHNARVLVAEHGKPVEIHFTANKAECQYRTSARWADGTTFEFTGFAAGYYGEGPRGLATFLQLCGLSIDTDQVAMFLDDKGKANLSFFPGE